MMLLDSFLWWPFAAAFSGVFLIFAVLILLFWIWMIVDCAQRKFNNNTEKIIWLLIIVLGNWFGALVYFLVVKVSNPRGIAR